MAAEGPNTVRLFAVEFEASEDYLSKDVRLPNTLSLGWFGVRFLDAP